MQGHAQDPPIWSIVPLQLSPSRPLSLSLSLSVSLRGRLPPPLASSNACQSAVLRYNFKIKAEPTSTTWFYHTRGKSVACT